MVVCVKMMSKGLKEALTVLIVTHVEGVESSVCDFYTTLYNRVMLPILLMSKGLKEALTVLIVTHVKRVQSSVCGFYTILYIE